MTVLIAKLTWVLGVTGWYVIRYPFERRSKRVATVRRVDRRRELGLLTISICGLLVVPLIYVVSGQPELADYRFRPAQAWVGTLTFIGSLQLLRRTHKDLGGNWSITLEIRQGHLLATSGVYRWVRHPMYSAFWMWALAQALLLPNWIAGLSGLVGFGTMFFCRVGREENMMIEAFGDEYRDYMARTRRIIPGIY